MSQGGGTKLTRRGVLSQGPRVWQTCHTVYIWRLLDTDNSMKLQLTSLWMRPREWIRLSPLRSLRMMTLTTAACRFWRLPLPLPSLPRMMPSKQSGKSPKAPCGRKIPESGLGAQRRKSYQLGTMQSTCVITRSLALLSDTHFSNQTILSSTSPH